MTGWLIALGFWIERHWLVTLYALSALLLAIQCLTDADEIERCGLCRMPGEFAAPFPDYPGHYCPKCALAILEARVLYHRKARR